MLGLCFTRFFSIEGMNLCECPRNHEIHDHGGMEQAYCGLNPMFRLLPWIRSIEWSSLSNCYGGKWTRPGARDYPWCHILSRIYYYPPQQSCESLVPQTSSHAVARQELGPPAVLKRSKGKALLQIPEKNVACIQGAPSMG